MIEILYKLPAVVIISAVVATFVSLYRNNRAPHTRLWLAGWAVMLFRACAQAAGPLVFPENWINAIDLACLEFSGMLFFLSGAEIFEVQRLRTAFLLTLNIPVIL